MKHWSRAASSDKSLLIYRRYHWALCEMVLPISVERPLNGETSTDPTDRLSESSPDADVLILRQVCPARLPIMVCRR